MRYLSSGESHGPALTVILEGLPAGISIDPRVVNRDLKRRQGGFGRGARMTIEKDKAEFLSGLWRGKTIGSPLTMMIKNLDWENWKKKRTSKKTVPRPGHADLPGLLKVDASDIQTVIERASARETAAKVAVGSIAKIYLQHFGVELVGHTLALGGVRAESAPADLKNLRKAVERSDLRCADKKAEERMREEIRKAMKEGDTLGGIVEVRMEGVPPGIGSYVQWDRRLDGRLAQALMAIPSVKAVSLGEGVECAALPGSLVHDPIFYSPSKNYFRKSNRAGGIEGGMSNGETIVARAYLKPISTLRDSLPTVDTKTRKAVKAPYVRSDTAVLPAAGVIGEAAAAWTLAVCYAEKFGGDSIGETVRNFKGYVRQVRKR